MSLSPYVPVHAKYVSPDVRENLEFWQAISAITDTEAPGWNTEAMGDAGCSHGLFQMNQCGGAGTGYSREQLTDPDFASRVMMPQFEAAYKAGKAQGLSGPQLAVYMGRTVERPRAGLEANYGTKFIALFGQGASGDVQITNSQIPTFEVTGVQSSGQMATGKADAIPDEITAAKFGPFDLNLPVHNLAKVGATLLLVVVALAGIIIIGAAASPHKAILKGAVAA
jgi:hypothetical protein